MRAIDQHRDPHRVADRHNVNDGQNEEIALLSAARERVAAAADIGFGNVVKILFRFTAKWWADHGARDLSDLSFPVSNTTVPTWWTQYPDVYSVLMGWLAGPEADRVSFTHRGRADRRRARLARRDFRSASGPHQEESRRGASDQLGNDRFARSACSYATPRTRKAQSVLRKPNGAIFFSGEALYAGPDMGTVEAALASGKETAQTIMIGSPAVPPRVL